MFIGDVPAITVGKILLVKRWRNGKRITAENDENAKVSEYLL